MIDVPISVPYVPTGARPSGSERLGLGQVAVQPEIDRPINDPEEANARRPIAEQPGRDDVDLGSELAVRARLSGDSEDGAQNASQEPVTSTDVASAGRRVEFAVRSISSGGDPADAIDTVA